MSSGFLIKFLIHISLNYLRKKNELQNLSNNFDHFMEFMELFVSAIYKLNVLNDKKLY